MESLQGFRKAEFKKALTPDDGRRRRFDMQTQIRKDKTEQKLAKRRFLSSGDTDSTTAVIGEEECKSHSYGGTPELALRALGCTSPDPAVQLESTKYLRMQVSVSDAGVHEVVSTGVVPVLIGFLSRNELPELQFEAAWCVSNIFSGDYVDQFMTEDLIWTVRNMLISPCEQVREQACWLTANICGDSSRSAQLVLGVPQFLEVVLQIAYNAGNTVQMNRRVAWTLNNLSRWNPPVLRAESDGPKVVQALADIVGNTRDKETLEDALFGLVKMTSLPDDGLRYCYQVMQCTSSLAAMVSLVAHESMAPQSCVSNALMVIGSIAAMLDERGAQAVIDCGFLGHLPALMCHRGKNIRKEACWIASNIAVGSEHQRSQLLSTEGFMISVVDCLKCKSAEVQQEAAWILNNTLCKCNADQAAWIAAFGIIPHLCEMLSTPCAELWSRSLDVMSALMCHEEHRKAFASAIEEHGGVDLLEELSDNPNEEIASKAYSLHSRYWQWDDPAMPSDWEEEEED